VRWAEDGRATLPKADASRHFSSCQVDMPCRSGLSQGFGGRSLFLPAVLHASGDWPFKVVCVLPRDAEFSPPTQSTPWPSASIFVPASSRGIAGGPLTPRPPAQLRALPLNGWRGRTWASRGASGADLKPRHSGCWPDAGGAFLRLRRPGAMDRGSDSETQGLWASRAGGLRSE
jgi:hypothetical protein